jgi:hypothetical protein
VPMALQTRCWIKSRPGTAFLGIFYPLNQDWYP